MPRCFNNRQGLRSEDASPQTHKLAQRRLGFLAEFVDELVELRKLLRPGRIITIALPPGGPGGGRG